MSSFDYQVKLLLVGDSGAGKTSLLLRYANGEFQPTFITTIGIDFRIKTIGLNQSVVKLQLWDTAGQERFKTITTSYFRGAQGILLVYDVTQRHTFDHIQNWAEQINQYGDLGVTCVLVGNKCDLEHREVSYEEGKALAEERGMRFFETSAKNNVNVTDAFESAASIVLNKLKQSRIPHTPKSIPIDKPQPSSSSCGCS